MIRRAVAVCLVLAASLVVGDARTPASAAPCAASAPLASSISVAVVVDFGDGSPVSAVCVPAGSTDNGAAVLAARAEQLGTTPPRFDQSSGLLCAIDGVPASGCGDQVGNKYAYWSYWHGTSSGWAYSNAGPGGSRVKGTASEGWRYNAAGAGNPTDPPPGGDPDPAATCAPPDETTTTTTAASSTPSSVGVPAPRSTLVPESSADPTTSSASSSSSSSSTIASGVGVGAPSGSVRVTNKSDGTSPLPVVGAGAAIVGLGVGGVVVSRRRRTPSGASGE